MKSLKTIHSLASSLRPILDEIRKVTPHFSQLIEHPVLLGRVLLEAHRAQVTLVLSLTFLIFVAPGVVDSVTGAIFPQETTRKVFGLIKKSQDSQLKQTTDTIIMTVLWFVGIATPLLMAWFSIPKGIVSANQHSRTLLNRADQVTDEISRQKLLLKATAYATEPELVSEIRGRLREGSQSFLSTPDAGQTMVSKAGDSVSMVSSGGTAEALVSQGLAERYEIQEQLGSGAMGIVFSAYDQVLDRKVAVKQLSMYLTGDEEYVLRFRREAKALARLNHQNVVQVYDLVEEGNRFWMVVEFVDGGDLASYLKDRDRLPVDEAVSLVIQIAQGLSVAHQEGIVHRDLKPANILLTANLTPKITDFGIAKMAQSGELTRTGSVLGSPPYMSPEQCSGGTVDHRTDIYALGITFYQLLTGARPFEGEPSAVLAKHLTEIPASVKEHMPDVSTEIDQLVRRMLAKAPENRPADLTEVVDLLKTLAPTEKSLEQARA